MRNKINKFRFFSILLFQSKHIFFIIRDILKKSSQLLLAFFYLLSFLFFLCQKFIYHRAAMA
ncbi:MAG: hypothetical protein IKL48_05435 [Elusimicrobiaceae bacterium]|nr:hypothetical protein [Elusimicrobiaceae bacterium]